MRESKSALLRYISHLLQNDDALKRFVVDPITDAEGKYGLTKAERAVLRRTVHHLPQTSLNGFSMLRHRASYRRSLRLLQNVLHNAGSKSAADLHVAVDGKPVTTTADDASGGTFFLYVYYPNVNGNTDFTCQDNDYVNNNYGGPYAQSLGFQIVFGSGSTTVERLLLGASQAFPDLIGYSTVTIDSENYVSAVTVDNEYTITADLSNSCYDLSSNPNANSVFWFYSINGKPGQGGSTGQAGQSFADYELNSYDTVYWQLIAPDASYGFQPCAPQENNLYAQR
ncbi:MAG: hypothetical protein AAF560_01600 [Acidobacteriota bacterium]